jgi:hypothetical protein
VDDRERRRKMALQLVLLLAQLGLMAWLLTPEHQRRQLCMRLARRTRTVALAAAKSAGRNGMALELAAGGEHAGKAWYEAARLLMTEGVDRAEAFYERQRTGH